MPTNHDGLNSILSQMTVPLDLVRSYSYDKGGSPFTMIRHPDVSASLSHRLVDRCDTDASLFDGFCPRSHRHVGLLRFFPQLTVDDNLLNSSNSNVTQLHCNQTPFNQIQVTVDTSCDAYRLSRTSQHDLCIRTEKPREKPNGDGHLPRAVEPV